MYEENRFIEAAITFLLKHRLLLSFLFIVTIVLFVTSRYSFISVDIKNSSQQVSVSLTLTEQSGKTTKTDVQKTNYRKLVSKGTYTVSASQDNKNSLNFVQTSGFFLTKKVEANLQSEKSRSFVGDNPEVCMNYIDSVLVSRSCNGMYKTLRVHMPATASQSTYVTTPVASGETILGIIQTKEGTVAMISPAGGTSSAGQLITLIGVDGKPSIKGRFHDELPVGKQNTITTYKDGFVVYDKELSYMNYYDSISDSSPESITVQKPKDKKLTPYVVASNQDTIAIGFMNEDKTVTKDHHTSKGLGSPSQIVIIQNGSSKIVSIPMIAERIELCGTQKLCVLSSKNVFVFSISGKRAQQLLSIPNAQAIESLNSRLIVVSETDVMNLNVDGQSGSIDYSLGEYKYCGTGKGGSGYVLCLISPVSGKAAVYISPESSNQDSIDKKILSLQKSKSVSLVSIYDKNIFVLPNYGSNVYNSSTKIYDYDPAIVQRMNTVFWQDLANSGIDTHTYSITGLRQ